MFKVFTNKLGSNGSTVIVFVAACAYLAYIATVSPGELRDQAPQVLLAAGAVARLLYKVDEAKAKATEAATVAVESKAVSVDNAEALATIGAKVDDNTSLTEHAVETVETTHQIVNSELSKWKQAVVDQSAQDRELILAQTKQLIADALATGLKRGREMAIDEATNTAVAVVAASASPQEPPS